MEPDTHLYTIHSSVRFVTHILRDVVSLGRCQSLRDRELIGCTVFRDRDRINVVREYALEVGDEVALLQVVLGECVDYHSHGSEDQTAPWMSRELPDWGEYAPQDSVSEG